MVETLRNRSEIDRTRFVPVCGHRPGHFGLGFVRFGGGDLGQKSTIFGRILKSCPGPFNSAEHHTGTQPHKHNQTYTQTHAHTHTPSTRLSYLAVTKLWIVVEAPRNRSEIDRNRFVPVCGHCPGHFWLGFVRFGADLDPKSTISGRILKSFPGPFSSAGTDF